VDRARKVWKKAEMRGGRMYGWTEVPKRFIMGVLGRVERKAGLYVG